MLNTIGILETHNLKEMWTRKTLVFEIILKFP